MALDAVLSKTAGKLIGRFKKACFILTMEPYKLNIGPTLSTCQISADRFYMRQWILLS
jgi:hypothetical protein